MDEKKLHEGIHYGNYDSHIFQNADDKWSAAHSIIYSIVSETWNLLKSTLYQFSTTDDKMKSPGQQWQYSNPNDGFHVPRRHREQHISFLAHKLLSLLLELGGNVLKKHDEQMEGSGKGRRREASLDENEKRSHQLGVVG